MGTEYSRSKARDDRMQRTLEREHAKEMENHKRETLNSLVREQVIHALGDPVDLLSVQIRPMWGTSYRVNVVVGSVTCPRISHSFFVVTDGDGAILGSTPKIERRY